MLDLLVNYQIPTNAADLALFLKMENLTDTEERVHPSFIKDVAPRPGRNIRVGICGVF